MLVIPSLKHKTKVLPIQNLEESKDYFLPLSGYRDQMELQVDLGTRVQKSQLLAQSQGVFASRIHAPVSGILKALVKIESKTYLHLENDFQNQELVLHPLDLKSITIASLVEHLLQCGIVGAGGSEFPTQVKYMLKSQRIHTLVFNGVECEPYLSADYVTISHKYLDLIKMAQVLSGCLNQAKVIFAIEKKHKELKAILLQAAQRIGLQIQVILVGDTYPQGGELQLVKRVTGIQIRKGTLPSSLGVVVSNIGTLWAMYNAVFLGKPFTERIITVSGTACANLGNYQVKVGTPIQEVLNQSKNTYEPGKETLVLGGAMMGKPIENLQCPIEKGTGGLLMLKSRKIHMNNCIKCGLCVDVCPQKLMPLEFVRYNILDQRDSLELFHVQDCIECGACAYVCPSEVALMENIFQAKSKLI